MNRSQTYTAVIERCPVTGDYVGRVPGFRVHTAKPKQSKS